MGELDAAVGAAVVVKSDSQVQKDLQRARDLLPRIVTVPASYIGTGTTYGFLSFPQVTPGKLWEVLRIGVVPTDIFTPLAGVLVEAVRTSTVPQDSNTEPSAFGDAIAVAGQVPNTAYPAWHSVFVRGNERIVLAFRTVPLGTAIQASMDVIEYDAASFLQSLIR